MSIAILGCRLPPIVSGPILVWLFGVWLKVLPRPAGAPKPPYLLGIFASEVSLELCKYALMPVVALGWAARRCWRA